MGVHVGEPRRVADPMTRRIEFTGPVVNTAARITTLSHGGQVLISEAAWDKIRESAMSKERNRLACVGKFEMPDSPEGTRLYELRARGLEARFFGGLGATKLNSATNDLSKDDLNEDSGLLDSSEIDHLTQVGDPMEKEDAFLASANLCRYVSVSAQLTCTRAHC
jgi:hypothetical protein